jgi:hypothetical protein
VRQNDQSARSTCGSPKTSSWWVGQGRFASAPSLPMGAARDARDAGPRIQARIVESDEVCIIRMRRGRLLNPAEKGGGRDS